MNIKNAYPVTDEVGAHSKPFRFKLTNTCGVGVNYNINLEVMETEKRIASNNIAVKVDESEKSILSDNAVATPIYKESDYTGVESYTVGKGELKPYDNVIHDVRIWLDKSAGNDTQKGTFYSKVIIEAIQNQKTAISLVDYLIDESYIDDAIEEFSHEVTYQTPALTDYRYTGANPNNYVYFGCEGESCTEENLYRIIGVIPTQSEANGEYINRVKLIKATDWIGTTAQSSTYTSSGKGYLWNTTNSNKWEESSLQKELNGEYWNNLGEYQSYISPAKWYLGAPTYNNITYTSDQFYSLERSNVQGYSKGALAYIGNIGLMYPSDYGYSIGNGKLRTISIYDNKENYVINAWMYQLKGIGGEWTITPEGTLDWNASNGGVMVFMLHYEGWFYYSHMKNTMHLYGVRPTFYLKSNVLYEKGLGTIDNPYRITIDE